MAPLSIIFIARRKKGPFCPQFGFTLFKGLAL
jgi:hypothetical protein